MDSDIQTYVISHSDDHGYAGRIDIVTGPTGRRRWPEHVKAAMVLETFRDGVTIADVARRHGVSAPQLHAWRRAAREGLLPMPEDDTVGFMPIMVSADGASSDRPETSLQLEIVGVRILVPTGFDAAHLGRVVAALRETSS